MKIDLSKDKSILVITGPESSGKTTLANKLSSQYEIPLVKEYAREYLNHHGPKYTFSDIQKIAIIQMENELEEYRNDSLIICDTDIVTLEIWALEKYETSLSIENELASKKHYLLCVPDIPWEPDMLRENPEDRMRLFESYKDQLVNSNLLFTVLNKKGRKDIQIQK